MTINVEAALAVLQRHLAEFEAAQPFAARTGHTVPTDTKSWSQILISELTGLSGLARKKGADLDDGSDVKGANTWEAIDTPRFNGVLSAGRATKEHSGKLESLNSMPYVFFVLWDISPRGNKRCRVWVVRAKLDPLFRETCARWYADFSANRTSNNFQLHPPRGLDSNVIRNSRGSLQYPLLLAAEVENGRYKVTCCDEAILSSGLCTQPPDEGVPAELLSKPAQRRRRRQISDDDSQLADLL